MRLRNVNVILTANVQFTFGLMWLLLCVANANIYAQNELPNYNTTESIRHCNATMRANVYKELHL